MSLKQYYRDKAMAWDAVAEALNDARPGWHYLADTGQKAAVAAIQELGERPKQRRRLAHPEYLQAQADGEVKTSNMYLTPRTDAAATDGWSGDATAVSVEFAQELERENNQLTQEVLAYAEKTGLVPKYLLDDALTKLRAHETSDGGWIAVTTRLPDFTKDRSLYIEVYSETHSWLGAQHAIMRQTDFWDMGYGGEHGTDDARTVTHWRPLRSPVKTATEVSLSSKQADAAPAHYPKPPSGLRQDGMFGRCACGKLWPCVDTFK